MKQNWPYVLGETNQCQSVDLNRAAIHHMIERGARIAIYQSIVRNVAVTAQKIEIDHVKIVIEGLSALFVLWRLVFKFAVRIEKNGEIVIQVKIETVKNVEEDEDQSQDHHEQRK